MCARLYIVFTLPMKRTTRFRVLRSLEKFPCLGIHLYKRNAAIDCTLKHKKKSIVVDRHAWQRARPFALDLLDQLTIAIEPG